MLGTELESFSSKNGDGRENVFIKINSRVFQTMPLIFVIFQLT